VIYKSFDLNRPQHWPQAAHFRPAF